MPGSKLKTTTALASLINVFPLSCPSSYAFSKPPKRRCSSNPLPFKPNSLSQSSRNSLSHQPCMLKAESRVDGGRGDRSSEGAARAHRSDPLEHHMLMTWKSDPLGSHILKQVISLTPENSEGHEQGAAGPALQAPLPCSRR
mmetsp:Transcript_22298/g.61674  ORF Transcript_22298/g.61674 Transcript_22298/m.61674 type:complete len:142 (-) Transcript_22298:3045-3470(-)